MKIGEKDPLSTRNAFIDQVWNNDSLNRFELDKLVRGLGIGPEADVTDASSKFVKSDPLQLSNAYETFKRDSSKFTDGKFNSTESTAKPVLRSRFVMPGQDSGLEPILQSIADVVNADLCSFVPSDGGVGLGNSLFLDNARHKETIRFAEPLQAVCRDVGDSHNLLGAIVGIDQIPRSIEQVDTAMRDIIDDHLSQLHTEHSAPGLSVGIKQDNLSYVFCPFGNFRRKGFMVPVLTRQSEYALSASNPYLTYRQDTSQETPFGFTDALGFKRSTNTLREPLAPETDTIIPHLTSEEQLSKLDRQGYDVFY